MSESDLRFANLRGVRWRVNLSVLPSHDSSSIDDLRRATAESRRRYASLRRRLLIDPHVAKDVRNSPDLSIDNPLSQNPDSTWGQFFRNAELEKTLDQDLSRLYPEHWSYFQAPGCQGMLRRILLLWCLKHPEFGYRQGMHELLAPLLYVLHVDIERLSEVRKTYEDHFTDRFDELSFEERDITYNFDFKKFLDSTNDEINQGNFKKIKNLEELDPEIQSIVMLSDAYGAEGELGIVLSEKFMEHDAYCMFDALMNGNRGRGCVAMAGFFAYSPGNGSKTGLPPVLEACTAFYNLLSFVDSSLYSHLVELGVEPQYFGLRWLRVLFGREFLLQDLLIVWDEIFSADNTARNYDNSDHSFRIFDSPRGALISGIAVSMILCLRSSLLATENAASCLQRLLNFPEKIDLKKILEKAKSLQGLTMESDVRAVLSANSVFDSVSPVPARTNSFPSGSTSPKSPLIITPESYWEEKWRVLNKAEEEQREKESKSLEKQSNNGGYKKKTWFKVKRLFRVESEPTQSKIGVAKSEGTVSSVARSLLEDFNREIDTESANQEITDDFDVSGEEIVEENLSGVLNPMSSEDLDSNFVENDSNFVENDPSFVENDPSFAENDSDLLDKETSLDSPLPISSQPSIEHPLARSNDEEAEEETTGKSVAIVEERKIAVLPGKFQWFWKFGRNLTGEESSEKSGSGVERCTDVENGKSDAVCGSEVLAPGKEGNGEQNVMNTLKNIGHSMLDHIQVIESVFQQEGGEVKAGLMENLSKRNLVGKGQVTALTAIKELRKISNLLLQM